MRKGRSARRQKAGSGDSWPCGSAVEAKDFPKTPGLAYNEIIKENREKVEEIDLFEINEAFAAVALVAAGQIAGLDLEKVNVNGGAVALVIRLEQAGQELLLR